MKGRVPVAAERLHKASPKFTVNLAQNLHRLMNLSETQSMPTMKLSHELEVALRAVHKAASVCVSIRSSSACEAAISKQDRSPVTIADFGSQAVIIRELLQAFPDAAIVAEEDSGEMEPLRGTELGQQMVQAVQTVAPEASWEQITTWVDRGNATGGAEGRFWTIDPIDGTKGFLRNEQYAVALALIENGIPVLGVLACPNYPVGGFGVQDAKHSGVVFAAVQGLGARELPLGQLDWEQAAPIGVSKLTSAAQARLCESVESGHSAHGAAAGIAQRLGLSEPPLRMDSQCKYGAVARGDASIYLRLPTSESYREKIWDHAAGWRVTREAGAEVTDVQGKSLDFSLGHTLAQNRGIVAAPASIHAAVIAAVRRELEG